MALEKKSPCKVNLLLNILGRRPDGFHELETILYPIEVFDQLTFERRGRGIELTCSEPTLPTDSRNLVYRAAELFLNSAGINDGVQIHLQKNIPTAAGLGGGSGNAATTLLGLNELFGEPLRDLQPLGTSLGSDIPFFLQNGPALGTGRGERIEPLGPFPALRTAAFILIHPGFGIATAWTYKALAKFPAAVNGKLGRAKLLIELLRARSLEAAGAELFNSLEAPVLNKYPVLALYQEFLRSNGAAGALMSGSGSTTFALVESSTRAEALLEKFKNRFGTNNWTAIVPARWRTATGARV